MKIQRNKKTMSAMIASILFIVSLISGIESVSPHVAAEGEAILPVEGFESTASLYASSAQANSVSLGLVSRPETIYEGFRAVRLSYDFTGKTGTSAAYVNFRDPDGSVGRTLQGAPKKIGLWVYGDGNNHWLRAQLQDSTGTKTPVDFTSSSGLSWTGWKYVTISVPTALKPPLKINQIYIAETKENNKNAGAIYFDRLSAFYTDSTVYGLDIVGLPPLQAGETKRAAVYATYQNGTEPTPVASGVTFASSNEQVATVGADGTVRALQPGSATITARYGTAPLAVYPLTVTADKPTPQRLELSAPTKLEAGSSGRVQAYAVYSGMAVPVAITDGAAFQSSNAAVATVDSSGLLRALKAGETTITAVYGGVSAQLAVTVTNPVPVLQKIEIVGLSSMTIGQSKQAKVLGTYTWLPEPVEITGGVTFTSSVPSVASVNSSGTVTALKVGGTRITAAYGGKSTDVYVVVNKEAVVPKTELRAAWIATVDNIDWPKKGVVEAEQQKRDYIELLDELQEAGMNAVIMQVKPTADAFYPSQYGPWSQWLTGEQGKDPGYNPLAFMLEETHKRNMEFHAWFNPYRISLDDRIDKLVPNHPARQHPDWVVSYGGKLYFNPGIPEAKQYIIDSIMEVVKGYDIDAVHFDDYFYPYPVTGVDFPDQDAYAQYGAGFPNKADWRRHNVDTFVQEMAAAIKREKSYVKFGISPFGIWKNKSQDPAGSETNGLSSYDAIYADSKKWVDRQWIDYIAPQIYWYFGYSPASYDKLIEWWSGVTAGKNVHLYSGQAAYRIGSGDPAWMNPDEMPTQIAYNRNFDAVRGNMFFSAKWLPANPLGFTDRLKSDLYRYPALVPAMPWLDSVAPAAPSTVSAVRKAEGIEVKWDAESSSDAAYYVVYRFAGNTAGSTQDASRIAGLVRKQPGFEQTFVDRMAADGLTYTYAVTAVDRLHNESAASGGATVRNVPDTTPPVTAAVAAGTERNGWYVSDVSVSLSAADDLSGVKRTEYSVDSGASWVTYTLPVILSSDGVHTLLYRSEDRAGNVEQPSAISVRIDRTPPEIRIAGAQTYTIDQTVTITCTVSDTVSGVVYNPCVSPLVNAPAYTLQPGTHTITVQAEDAAGHRSEASATYTIEASAASLMNVVGEFLTGPGKDGLLNSLAKKLEFGHITPFINEIRAHAGNRLTPEQAEIAERLAEALR